MKASGSFSLIVAPASGSPGSPGQGVYKSIVFIRTNTTPGTPSGGSFASPLPTTAGWSDGVPDGSPKLWVSTRIFSSDGLAPQQTAWMAPKELTSTSGFEVRYSAVASPGNPTSNPANWSTAASSSSIWMATRTTANGVLSAWEIVKIKGENGADALTLVISKEHIGIACDSAGNAKTGELGATGKTLFTLDVWRGSTKLTFATDWVFHNNAYANIVVGQISGTSTLFISGITAVSGYVDFTVRVGSNIYLTKRLNASKIIDGAAGQPGDPGADGYTLQLTNIAHSVACDSFGTANDGELGPSGKAITTVNVYKGATKLTYGTGWSFDGASMSSAGLIYAQQSGQPTLYVNSMSGDSGHVTIAVKIGTVVLIQKWIITKQKDGRSDIASRKAAWVTGKQYYKGLRAEPYLDFVKYENLWYMCKVSHVSGTFTTDLNAGRWAVMNNFENVATDLLLARKILADEIDADNLIARNMRTANSGARVEAFGSEQNFYNENGVKQMQIGIVNGNVVLTYFAPDGSKLYDLGPGGFNWGSIKPASWTPYTIKRMDTPTLGAFPTGGTKPTWGNLESYCAGFDVYAAISGQTYYTYYAGVNPTITEADRAKEQFLYATQSLTNGYCPDGWYISVEKPRVLPGEQADVINPSTDWLKPAPLNRNYAIHTRRMFEYIGGKTARIMNVAWNDRSAVPEV